MQNAFYNNAHFSTKIGGGGFIAFLMRNSKICSQKCNEKLVAWFYKTPHKVNPLTMFGSYSSGIDLGAEGVPQERGKIER